MEAAWTIFCIYVVLFGSMIAGGLFAERSSQNERKALLKAKKNDLVSRANRFNQQIKSLEQAYKQDKKALKGNQSIFQKLTGQSTNSLRKEYENRYSREKTRFSNEVKGIIQEWNHQQKSYRKWSHYWKALIVVGLITTLGACSHALAIYDETSTPQNATISNVATENYWRAEDIPMPHLTDASRYVSNPDSIISQETVKQLDAQLKQLDDSLGIESVLAVVSHIEGGDIEGFAQDIFDIYKVGKSDYGLVMVLAYDDHKFRTQTGRSLEVELTDVECFRLQERYLIPSMKAEMPDSGLIYMVEAIYNTLKGKDLPIMSEMTKKTNSKDDSLPLLPLLYLFIAVGWIIFYFMMASRHGWGLMSYALGMLTPNPFIERSQAPGVVIFGSGGGRSGGFGGGGGSFGGGFSGGSSGGGGATSSW